MKKCLLLLLVSFNVTAQVPIVIVPPVATPEPIVIVPPVATPTPPITTTCTSRGNVVYCW